MENCYITEMDLKVNYWIVCGLDDGGGGFIWEVVFIASGYWEDAESWDKWSTEEFKKK